MEETSVLVGEDSVSRMVSVVVSVLPFGLITAEQSALESATREGC